ncbi:MAG: hypothetical protein AAFO95_12760 [Cyanobacteria bacterium J06600_6]
MKIYLPICLAISALAILTTSAQSMEKASVDTATLRIGVMGFDASKLDSATADILSFNRSDQKSYVLNLSANNDSLTLNTQNISKSNTTVRNNNLEQNSYATSTTIARF